MTGRSATGSLTVAHMRLRLGRDARIRNIHAWRQSRSVRHHRTSPTVAKMQRQRSYPRWWEALYRSHVSDGGPTAWSIFLAEMVARPGWSVARLARESGLNRSSIFRWLRGDGGLTLHSVRRIAQALDVDPAAAMLAAGSMLGPPSVEDDPEMRTIMESRLAPSKKEAIVARVRARRVRDMEDTLAMIELAAGGEPDVG